MDMDAPATPPVPVPPSPVQSATSAPSTSGYGQRYALGYPQHAYAYAGVASQPINKSAALSFSFGVASLFFGFVLAIIAVVWGHMARRQIAVSGERGDGLAVGALVLGYISIVLTVLVIGFFLLLFVVAAASPGVPSRL